MNGNQEMDGSGVKSFAHFRKTRLVPASLVVTVATGAMVYLVVRSWIVGLDQESSLIARFDVIGLTILTPLFIRTAGINMVLMLAGKAAFFLVNGDLVYIHKYVFSAPITETSVEICENRRGLPCFKISSPKKNMMTASSSFFDRPMEQILSEIQAERAAISIAP